MNRETRDIKIPLDDKEIVVQVYTYLTGKEKHEMTKIIASEGNFGTNSDIGGGSLMKAQDFLLKTCIVSVNGSSENACDQVLNMHSDVYDVVLKEINSIFGEQKKSLTK